MNFSYFSESEFKILLNAAGAKKIFAPAMKTNITQSEYNEGIFSLTNRGFIFNDNQGFVVSDRVRQIFEPIRDAVELLLINDLVNCPNIILYLKQESSTIAQTGEMGDFYIRMSPIKTADVMDYLVEIAEGMDYIYAKKLGDMNENIKINLKSGINILDSIKSEMLEKI